MAVLKEIIKPNYSLMNRPKIEGEMYEDSIVWRDFLFGIVPINRLRQCYIRACQKQSGSFAPNYFNVKNEWQEIEAEEKAKQAETENEARKENPVLYCSNKENHINESGDIKVCNPLNFNEEIILPCNVCRLKAYDDQRTRYIAKNKIPEVKPLEIVQKLADEKKPKVEEVWLSADEAEALLTEHNSLVRQIVGEEDTEARRNLELVYDEGGNCFKLPHRADITYSPDAMRKKIEDYKRILGA